jgi:AraC-like DNA-binding protein
MKALFEKVPLTPGETVCCQEFRVPRFTMPWHFHPECELTLIVRGRGMRYVGDHIERFGDGDLVFLGPDLPHYWWNDADDPRGAHSIVVQFGAQFEGGAIFELAEAAPVRRLLEASRRGLAFAGEPGSSVARDMSRLLELDGWRRLCLLLDILGRLAGDRRARTLASAGFVPSLHEADARRLNAVCRYVNEHYAGPVVHRVAAQMAGFSPAAFSRFFRRQMGKTFESYVVEIRIGHACRTLLESERTVLEAALAAGFNNLSNFNKHFKRLKGVTPRAFRRLAARTSA